MKRISFLVVVLALVATLAVPGARGTEVGASPGNLTISTARTFASLDGSGSDDDLALNGVLTVKGNLLITSTGSITQVAPNPIKIVVTGDMQMNAGSFISSIGDINNNGGAINITVGNFTVTPPTGTFAMATGATIKANGFQGGPIVINAGDTIDVDGLVESAGMGSGSGTNQGHGGTIFLDAGCYLNISDTGHVRSYGRDPGADLVHLEACEVVIYGLVESTGSGHGIPSSPPNHLDSTFRPGKPASSTAGVEVWAGTILIDKTGTHNGEIKADLCCGGGTAGTSWIDLFASGDITIIGASSGDFAVHANENMGTGGSGSQGGIVTAKSVAGKIMASGLAIQADGLGGGGDGGQIIVEAASNITLDNATIYARGDYNQSGGYGTGGRVGTLGGDGIGGGNDVSGIRSFNGTISWIGGVGDVRPTGTDNVGTVLPAASRGEIILQDCTAGSIDMTGTSFPNNGVPATTPTELADTCGGAPTLQAYVVLPPCDICVGCHATLKIIKVVDGPVPTSDWGFTSNITGHESFSIPAAGGSVTFDPIDPGRYSVAEIPKTGYGITPSNPQQIVVGGCEDAGLTFTNTFSECACNIDCNRVDCTICEGGNATLTASGGDTYSWSANPSGTPVIGTDAAITVSPTSATTYYVTVTNSTTGCSSNCSKTVTVNPLPDCGITADDNVCTESAGNTASAPEQAGVTYSWSIEGNGIITSATNLRVITWNATGPGTATLKVRVTNTATGCYSDCQKVVGVESCDGSLFTNTSYCEFDHDPSLPGDQFRLLYRFQAAPNSYLLNGSNPGQFYYNVFYDGDPGDPVGLTITIPYPFVTHGAVPIHAYSTYTISSNGMDGRCLHPGTDVTGDYTINTAGGNLSPSGAEVIVIGDYTPKDLGTNTTVTVQGVIPTTGHLYVTVHLEYGLKKTSGWNKLAGDAASGGPYSDTINEPQSYAFSFSDGGSIGDTQITQSVNEFKKPAGFMGFASNQSDNPINGAKILIYNGANRLVGTIYTDADGYYYLAYKHKAKLAYYTVKLVEYGAQRTVPVQANGFAVVDFMVP